VYGARYTAIRHPARLTHSEVQVGNGAPLMVADLSESIAGQFCTRLLAHTGAAVTLIEPPGGSWTRRRGPFLAGARRPDDSCLFFHLNQAKRSVTLDYATPSGEELLAGLLAGQDVILLPGDDVARRAVLASVAGDDRVITCAVDDFEQAGSVAGWAGEEMVFQAMSGVMFENGGADREPLYGCGYRSLYATGAAALIAVEAALVERESSARGQLVGAAAGTVAASMNYNRGTQYWYNQTLDYRDDPITPRMTLRCRDGWIVAFPGAARWAATCEALELTDLLADPGLQLERDRMSRWPELRARLQQEVAGRTVQDVVERAQRHHAVLSAVLDPAQLLESPQLAQREYWQAVEFEGRPRVALGPWARFSDSAPGPQRPPYLGEHTAAACAALEVSDQEQELLRNCGII
jgi:crotonobetainyl-CoA:carnitine CoA-transferase CaiB-like acyl-CoA transferase